jgi:hypothetical protein
MREALHAKGDLMMPQQQKILLALQRPQKMS